MKKIGIVAEYNPFHKGHLYQIEATREKIGDCAIVAVMSGDYVQRGEIATFDKHVRAKAAVCSGADLVIELPLPWAIASAEGFSRGAIGLLNLLGVVDAISFGSECGEVDKLRVIAHALLSPEMDEKIRTELKKGISYAQARQRALHYIIGENAELIEKPNNILGIEYLKQIEKLGSHMDAITITRQGAKHDEEGDGDIRSASEIRKMIISGDDWSSFVPERAFEVYKSAEPIDRERIEIAMMSRLRWLENDAFQNLPDEAEGLGNRLYKSVQQGRSVEEILTLAKSKRYAMARLRRMLLAATLGVTADMADGTPQYARVLAANKTGLKVLSEIAETSDLDIITKPAHGNRLSGKARECFEICAKSRDLYTLCYKNVEKRAKGEDYKISPAIIY